MSSTSSSPTGGDAALRVLTDPLLFRLIPQWVLGWPRRLLERWRQLEPVILRRTGMALPKWYKLSNARRVELFMRELMLAGDVEILQLTAESFWCTSESRELRRFQVKDPQFAVRSGHADTVRWVFGRIEASSDPARRETRLNRKRDWLWQEAMAHFPGHCEVLDVLQELLPTDRQFWLYKDERIRDVAAAQWIIATLGTKALPRATIVRAALNENLALVDYLLTVEGQDLTQLQARVDEYSPQVVALVECPESPQVEPQIEPQVELRVEPQVEPPREPSVEPPVESPIADHPTKCTVS